MSKKNSSGFAKKTVSNLLATAVILGLIAVPMSVAAVGTTNSEDTVIYDNQNYAISKYWNEDEVKRTAPVKEGYVFGGWYEDEGITPLTQETAASATTAYAKFVPAYVLSVKAQNEEGTSSADGKNSSIRVISSVDSTKYQKVGFEILLNNTKSIGTCETTNVYTGLKNSTSSTPQYPGNVFGTASTHFSVWRLDNIADANDSKIIYVRPYWITPDGTKVEGMAKYVHIEDEYKGYISVPINLLTGEAVAAGSVQMSYDAEKLTFVSFEAGRLLPEMNETHTTAGTLKIIGNAAKANEVINADGIYANIRFKTTSTDVSNLTFDMTAGTFCNWKEELIKTVKAWDYRY